MLEIQKYFSLKYLLINYGFYTRSKVKTNEPWYEWYD